MKNEKLNNEEFFLIYNWYIYFYPKLLNNNWHIIKQFISISIKICELIKTFNLIRNLIAKDF